MSTLDGLTIVVTRADHQAASLTGPLQALGATTIELPVIGIIEPSDNGQGLRSALERLSTYHWVVLTSVNAAVRVAPFLHNAEIKIAAIGPSTASIIEAEGLEVDLIPEQHIAESLVKAFPPGDGTILVPRAAVAREELISGLLDKGWRVDVVEAYRTERPQIDLRLLESVANADVITFTSASTVESYLAAASAENIPRIVACIGPITSQTASSMGLHVDIVADDHTIAGLVSAISNHFATKDNESAQN